MEPSSNSADIRQALQMWLSAFNKKDADALLSLYDPGSVYANSNAPLMVGPTDIRPWYENSFTDTSLRVFFHEETLFESDEMALIAGQYHFKRVRDDGSYEPGGGGRVALLFRRSPDGRWLLAYDIDNTPPDVTADDVE